jgi:hypothetical protein
MTEILKKGLIILLNALCLASVTFAQASRNYLSGSFTSEQVKSLLIKQESWHPWPSINDREKWAAVPESTEILYIKDAEQYLGKPWEILPATSFLDYARNGNRSRYENICFGRRQRLARLVMAEVLENKGRFTDAIADGLWAICEETFWGVPAHIGAQKRGSGLPDATEPVIDLFAAETGALLAWTYYLTGDKLDQVSPLLKERIYLEENRRIITPFLERKDFWWMGFNPGSSVNNWNPWINSNLLNIVLFLEKNDARRAQAVYKSMQSIDVFMNGYPDDGGCDEGPGYWGKAGGSLFDYLDLLYLATDGKINIYNESLVQKIGQFIYKAWIHDDYYINFADASAINQPEAGLVYRFGKRINDPIMIGFGAFLAQRQNVGKSSEVPDHGSMIRFIPDLLATKDLLAEKPVEPYISDFWLPGLQVMAARSHPDSEKDIYVAAKGGHNAESHNHNDVGNFIVYADGRPLLIDIGVETYTSKTFSSNRYDIWTMQSQYHNLPTINGVQQTAGREFRAENPKFVSTAKQVSYTMDIAKAYPPEAMVSTWNRKIFLDRGKKLVLSENYQLREWKEPVRINFMTAFNVNVSIAGQIILTDKADASRIYEMVYDPAKFRVAAEVKEVADERLIHVWGNRLTRLVFTAQDKSLKGQYQVELKKKLK